MTNKIKTISYDSRARVFWLMVTALVCLVFVHVIAVGATTRNIAIRQVLEKEIMSLEAEIGSLEFASISQKNAINLELALSKGFSEKKNPTYIARVESGLGKLTLNH